MGPEHTAEYPAVYPSKEALEEAPQGSAAALPEQLEQLGPGRVHVVARGPREACQRLLDQLRGGDTPGTVETVVEDWSDAGEAFDGFVER